MPEFKTPKPSVQYAWIKGTQTSNPEVVYTPTPAERPSVIERVTLAMGAPFLRTGLFPHKVVEIYMGHPIRVQDIEKVYNDALLMDWVYQGTGAPKYGDTLNHVTRRAYELAQELYTRPVNPDLHFTTHKGNKPNA